MQPSIEPHLAREPCFPDPCLKSCTHYGTKIIFINFSLEKLVSQLETLIAIIVRKILRIQNTQTNCAMKTIYLSFIYKLIRQAGLFLHVPNAMPLFVVYVQPQNLDHFSFIMELFFINVNKIIYLTFNFFT